MIRPVVELVAKFVDEITDPLRGTSQGVKGLASDMEQGFTASMTKMGEAVVGFFAIAKLTQFFEASIRAASEERVSYALLKTAIEDTGRSYKELGGSAEASLAAQSKLTNFADSDMRAALARLIAKTGDAAGSIQNLGLVTDVATALHKDLADAVDLVALAMEGNIRKLKMQGIIILEGQDPIKVFNELMGGMATKAREADGGVAHLTTVMKEAREEFGKQALSVDQATAGTTKLEGLIKNVATFFGWIFGRVLGFLTEIGFALEVTGVQFSILWQRALKGSAELVLGMANVAEKGFGWLPGVGDAIRAAAERAKTWATEAAGHADAVIAFTTDNLKRMLADGVASGDAAGKQLVAFTKETWAAQVAQAIAQGAVIETEDRKLKSNLEAAAKHLAQVRKQYEQDGVASSAQGRNAILAASIAYGEAETALREARAKRAGKIAEAEEKKEEEEQTRAVLAFGTAQEKISKAIDATMKVTRTLNEEFARDFAGEMPKAAEQVQKKIDSLNNTLGDLRKEEATRSYEQGEQVRAAIENVNHQIDAYGQVRAVLVVVGQLAEQVALEQKDPEVPRTIERVNEELDIAYGLLADTLDNTLARAAAEKVINDLLKERARIEKKEIIDTDKAANAAQRNLDAIKRSVDAGVQLGEKMGLIDVTTGNILRNTIGFADSLGKALKSGASGDWLGAVVSFGSLLSSLFGDSPEATARKALVQKNNEMLAALTAIQGKLVLQNDTGAQISGLQTIANAPGGSPLLGGFGAAFDANASARAHEPRVSVAGVAGVLRPLGLTLAELRQVAKDLTIDLGEDKGTFSGSGLAQLVTQLKTLGPNATAFDGGFQGTLDRFTFGEGLQGGSLTLQDYADTANGPDGSPFLASLFQGLDLTKAADLATLRSRIKTYGAELANGQVGYAYLGSLSAPQTASALTAIAGLAAPASGAAPSAPPAAAPTGSAVGASVGAALYAPPPSGSYAPSATSGTTWDLSPVVNAILTSNVFLAQLVASNDAIAGHTAALAADLTKGGLMVTVLTGAQQAADLTGANTGQRG